jgi:hypothetical protein
MWIALGKYLQNRAVLGFKHYKALALVIDMVISIQARTKAFQRFAQLCAANRTSRFVRLLIIIEQIKTLIRNEMAVNSQEIKSNIPNYQSTTNAQLDPHCARPRCTSNDPKATVPDEQIMKIFHYERLQSDSDSSYRCYDAKHNNSLEILAIVIYAFEPKQACSCKFTQPFSTEEVFSKQF